MTPPPQKKKNKQTDERSGFDVLVASDAVGLGLNLSIGRIIFHSTEKFDGAIDRRLDPAEIKQARAYACARARIARRHPSYMHI